MTSAREWHAEAKRLAGELHYNPRSPLQPVPVLACLLLAELLWSHTGAGCSGVTVEVGRTATPRAQRVPPTADPPGFPFAGRGTRPVSRKRRRASR